MDDKFSISWFSRRSLSRIGLTALLFGVLLGTTPAQAQWTFVRGDSNDDAVVNIADAITILSYLFQGPSVLPCDDAADVNDDGGLDIADAIFLLDSLFGGGGTSPSAPFPDCGDDPTPDALTCDGPLTGCPALPSGCQDNGECPPGEFCEKPVGDCNGVGTCAPIPFICTAIFDPVCGCDGNDYPNACEAAAQGVSVDTLGSCPIAGCTDNTQCPAGEYCEKAVGDCNGVGTCAPIPFICPGIFDPVCGCDGADYASPCNAAAAGVSVDTLGNCPIAGCTDNTQCPAGEYCEKAVGDCNGVGTCAAIPFICTAIFDPVCGCDGNDYPNACEAAAQGVSVDFTGPC